MNKFFISFLGVPLEYLRNKIPFFIYLVTLLLINNPGTLYVGTAYADVTLLTINLQDAKIVDVLDEIEQKSEFYFLYNSKLIDVERIVSVSATRKPIQSILGDVFKGTDIEYDLSDRQIILRNKKMIPGKSQQIGNKVTGLVLDSYGEPIIGASVSLEGTGTGTITGLDGEFELLDVPQNARLQISYIGFLTQTVSVAGKSIVNITLMEDVQKLEEVVVIGYGTQKKMNLTGSVASISAQDLVSIPVSNLSSVMAGRMPGVFANNRSGAPGASSPLTIRGKNTPNYTDPTYVIDGVVRKKEDFDGLDPNEVESISVLKDAASAAVYGSRASNGVIVVSTKRGQNQKLQFRYTALFGTERSTKNPQVMNAYERTVYLNNKYMYNGVEATDSRYYSADEQEYFKTHSTDWLDMAWKNPFIQQHNISVNGGSEQIRYFMSAGYYDQIGSFDNLGYKRYNFRSNVDARINEYLSVGLDIDANMKKREGPYWPYNGDEEGADDVMKDLYRALLNFPTTEPAYVNGRPNATIYNWNILEVIKNGGQVLNNYNTLNAKLTATYKIPFVEGLSIGGLFNYRRYYENSKQIGKEYTLYIHEQSGSNNHIIRDDAPVVGTRTRSENGNFVRKDFSENSEYTLNLQLNYNRSFGKHDIGTLFVYEQYERWGDEFYGERKELLTSAIDEMFVGSADGQYKDASGWQTEIGRIGYVGRINYAYDNRYLVEVNFRYDGSSKWAPGKRWGFFPSVSAAWRITEEQFFRDKTQLEFINNLKLRASYGVLGNDGGKDVNYFQYLSKYKISKALQFGSFASTGILPDVYPNPYITWEKSATLDIGFDISMWNGLLSLEFDYFYKRTYDILADRVRTIPGTFGATLPKENYAELKNKGVDFLVRHDNRIDKFNYYITGNFSFARNHYTKIDESANAYEWQKKTGRPLNFWTGYIAEGIARTEQDLQGLPLYNGGHSWSLGDIILKDINSSGGVAGPDGIVDGNDQAILSLYHKDPEIIYGFSLGGEWKGIDFNIFFQGVGHRDIVFENRGDTWTEQTVLAIWTDAYSPDNINGKYPRVGGTGSVGANSQSSSFWLMNGNYLRCKNLEIGYTLPKQWMNKVGANNCRIYASGTNLFVFDKIGIYDPENSGDRGAYQYPMMKSFNFGLSLSF